MTEFVNYITSTEFIKGSLYVGLLCVMLGSVAYKQWREKRDKIESARRRILTTLSSTNILDLESVNFHLFKASMRNVYIQKIAKEELISGGLIEVHPTFSNRVIYHITHAGKLHLRASAIGEFKQRSV